MTGTEFGGAIDLSSDCAVVGAQLTEGTAPNEYCGAAHSYYRDEGKVNQLDPAMSANASAYLSQDGASPEN